jgi:hypothetical protein
VRPALLARQLQRLVGVPSDDDAIETGSTSLRSRLDGGSARGEHGRKHARTVEQEGRLTPEVESGAAARRRERASSAADAVALGTAKRVDRAR